MTSTTESILLTRLRTQLEFYFSPPNLARDVYLRNLLNSYGGTAVPLSIIANFPKVRNLCNGQIDLALLKRSVEGSGIVTVTSDAVWISPLLPLPPLDITKPQQRAPLATTQPPQQQQQQAGVSAKAGDTGDGSRTASASSSQTSLTAMGNGYANENGAYSVNNTNAAAVPGRPSDSSRANQSQHPGHNSLSETTQTQLPSQPAQLSTAAPPPHQQPHPAHPNAIPYPAAPIGHPSHGATTYAYPHYAYRYPPGIAGGPAYHHHPTGGYSAYPSHMVPYHIYGYSPYVNDGGRGYFASGRGSGGQMGARPNGEVENGGMRRSSTGKGNADGSKKGKGKSKKVAGMQQYQNQAPDSVGNANNNFYGVPAQQQQQQRWKERNDGGNSSGNDTYGKPTGKNHHQSRGVGKYDANWDRTNRGNSRSQNDIIPPTDADGRIGPGDTNYAESTNPLVRGGGGPLNTKPAGSRKKKNKRRDGDAERRRDSNLAQNNEDPKREIFDASSFPALSPAKIETSGGNSGSNETKNASGDNSGLTKITDPNSTSMQPISGYADALKQTKPSKPQTAEQQSSASVLPGGLSHNDKVAPQNTTTSTVVTPPPSESTTTSKVEDTLADLKITTSSIEGSPKPQESQMVSESQTTIAVGALTGMPATTTEVEPNITDASLESTVSLSPQSSVSPTETASNVQQSDKTEPTPREASHNIPKPAEEDVTSEVVDGSGGIAQVEEPAVVSSASSSSPPSAWGNKRSWIDVARKQS